MSDRLEPDTHIDILVIKNLILTRLKEGREMMHNANVPTDWKKRENIFQEKVTKAVNLINEAINAKEGKFNEVSNKGTNEGNKGSRETDVQNQENKA